MPNFQSLAHLGREVEAAGRDLEREARTSIALSMAKAGQKIARVEASRDLGGDPKFSGWRPRLATVVKRTRDGAVLTPTRRSAGPWTVAELGRNKGNAKGFQGPGVSRKTGLTSRTKKGNIRKVRAVKSKRWNGYTAGKGTATRAGDRMDKELPPIAEKASRKVLLRRFDVS